MTWVRLLDSDERHVLMDILGRELAEEYDVIDAYKRAILERLLSDLEGAPNTAPVPVSGHKPEIARAIHPAAMRYQTAFADEAHRAMGGPSLEEVTKLLEQEVIITFNVAWHPARGKLTRVVSPADSPPYLLLDHYHERQYPLYAIEKIEAA